MPPDSTSRVPPVSAKPPPARKKKQEAIESESVDASSRETSGSAPVLSSAAVAIPAAALPAPQAKPVKGGSLTTNAASVRPQVSNPPAARGELDLDDVETVDEVEEIEGEGASEEAAEPATDAHEKWFSRERLQGYGACFISMLSHAVLLMVMAYVVVSDHEKPVVQLLTAQMFPERPEEDLLKSELDMQVEASTEIRESVAASAVSYGAIGEVGGAAGVAGAGGSTGAGGVAAPTLDRAVMEQFSDTGLSVAGPLDGAPVSRKLITSVPDGALGDPRAIVDTYQEAMDRMTQEILWMLSKGKVLVVWSFDQSESMKDDQIEIRDRVNRVYTELGLATQSDAEALSTAITSFGAGFLVHTKRPTSELGEIRAAIDSVPIDPSGKEMLCNAVSRSILTHREYANRNQRQMALVVVTDEAGDSATNQQFLEQTIAEARAARCRVYILGREAVFGYPYAHMAWQHPQTKRTHWLPIDRGPETAFVEQLQTDGFHRRYDAHASGFGPYEQTRLARETGGVFFMLPSIETNLVRGEKRRYELEAMRAYVPDLRSRIEVITDRDNSQLRMTLWKVINDLNPYVPDIARIIEMRVEFSTNPVEFVRQARTEQVKALVYLPYLARAQQELEKIRFLRQQEVSPRWQANYDIMLAQLIAYQARIYEYGAYLEYFIRNPKRSPLTKLPNLTLVNWDIRTRPQLLKADESQPYIDRATVLFQGVIRDHPGTPWSARAELELKRGFGVELIEDYEPPYFQPSGTPIPIPKL